MPLIIDAMVEELITKLEDPTECVFALTLRDNPELLTKRKFEENRSLLNGIMASPQYYQILNNHQLLDLLTVEGVNTPTTNDQFYEGTSSLYWPTIAYAFTDDEQKIQEVETFFNLLLERNLINEQGLSASCLSEGDHQGCTPIFWFTYTEYGRDFLKLHPTMLSDFTSPEALNTPVSTKNTDGEPTTCDGMSTLSCLVFDENKKGNNKLNLNMLKLLKDDSNFFSKTTAKGWNVCIDRLTAKNKQPLIAQLKTWLNTFEAGQTMLAEIENASAATETTSASMGRGIFTRTSGATKGITPGLGNK